MRSFLRSPHLLEVFIGYGSMNIGSLILCLFYFYSSLFEIFYGYFIGMIMYTFMEYWFHRLLLHHWVFKQSHYFHHKTPTKLKIICTPFLPVQVYSLGLIFLLAILIGPKKAFELHLGMSFSQPIMDTVHLLEHSKLNPWWLKAARHYHHHHHLRENWDIAHGLTSTFWDFIFGTLPYNWSIYQKYFWLRYFHLPFPLLGFWLLTPFIPEGKTNLDIQNQPVWQNWKDAKLSLLLLSFFCGSICGFNPFVLLLFNK